MPPLDNILTALTTLPDNALQQIEQKIKALRCLSGTKPAEPECTRDYLIEGIAQELYRRGLSTKASLPSKITAEFTTKSFEIRTILERYISPAMTPTEEAVLGQLVAKLIAKDLARRNKDISKYSMLHSIPRVLELLDAAYPNYLKSGLLPFCWRRAH